MNNTVNFRCVADMTDFHVNINEILKPFHFNGQGRPVREVVDQGFNLAEVDGFAENFFHNTVDEVLQAIS